MGPRRDAELVVASGHRREQPGADDVVALRAHVEGEDPIEAVGAVLIPESGDLRGQRRGRPGVEDVGVAGEAARLVALVGAETGRRVGRRVDREIGFVGHERVVVHRLAGLVEAIPHRDRHTEESLARHEPVAVEPLDPVLVAMTHVVRMPDDVVASGDERGTQVAVLAAVADVPLA